MSREFHGFGEFARYVGRELPKELIELEGAAHEIGKLVVKRAKEEIGTYQGAIDGFPAWAPLMEATREDRLRRGYTEDDPLLRSGHLRDTISYVVEGLDVIIGSTADIMVWQELGTVHIPPRPVLGPAALRERELIEQIVGYAAITGFVGRNTLPGYNWKID